MHSANLKFKMARLNEDILRIIFDNFDTPLEWVQVSEGKSLVFEFKKPIKIKLLFFHYTSKNF